MRCIANIQISWATVNCKGSRPFSLSSCGKVTGKVIEERHPKTCKGFRHGTPTTEADAKRRLAGLFEDAFALPVARSAQQPSSGPHVVHTRFGKLLVNFQISPLNLFVRCQLGFRPRSRFEFPIDRWLVRPGVSDLAFGRVAGAVLLLRFASRTEPVRLVRWRCHQPGSLSRATPAVVLSRPPPCVSAHRACGGCSSSAISLNSRG
jgi:hypothetical protein